MVEQSLYDLLGVLKTATEDEIKKAYKTKALLWHPDRNPGNLEEADKKFKQISEARDILTDPVKRNIYDQKGLNGLKELPQDPFAGMQRQQGPDIRHEIELTLEELYTGITKELTFDKLMICDGCKGSGGSSSAKCPECSGVCFIENKLEISSGFFVIQKTVCQKCHGSGKCFNSENVCKTCWGERRVKKSTTLNCVISPGMSCEQRLGFRGESHEVLGPKGERIEPGNVFVFIKELPHSRFIRKGINLMFKKTITLKEALCGTSFDFIHLDGIQRNIKLDRITFPGYILTLPDLGMINGANKGSLTIEFIVKFPESLTEEQKLSLSILL